jgi:hypothetical protein
VDSLIAHVETYDFGAPLTIQWPPSNVGDVYIRANATKRDLHYRMDAQVAKPATRFSWKTDILAAERIEARLLRLAVWEVRNVGADWVRVYHPATLVQRQPEPPKRQRYRAVLWTERELGDVLTTLERLDARGSVDRTIITKRREGGVPAETQFDVWLDVAGLDAAVYRVTLEFETIRNPVGPVRLYLLHAP